MNRCLMAIGSSPAPSSPSCNATHTQSWQLLASRTPLLDDVDVDILGVIAIREHQDGRYYRTSDGEVVQIVPPRASTGTSPPCIFQPRSRNQNPSKMTTAITKPESS